MTSPPPPQVFTAMVMSTNTLKALHRRQDVVEDTLSVLQEDCSFNIKEITGTTPTNHPYQPHTHHHHNNVQDDYPHETPTRWRRFRNYRFSEHRSLSSTRCPNTASEKSKRLISPYTRVPLCQGQDYCFLGLGWVPLLLLLLQVLGVVMAEQTGTATLPKHFLETELPVLDVYGVEGGEARIPCDVTPPTPRDTPILILIARGTTPLFSVDARSGSSSPPTHWTNLEVLGDRAQFQLPARFRSLGDADFSKFPHNYDPSSPHQAVNRGSLLNYIPDQQLQHQTSRQYIYNTIEDGVYQGKLKDKAFDIQISRGKHKKVVRHAHDADFNDFPYNGTDDKSIFNANNYHKFPDIAHVQSGARGKQKLGGSSNHRKCLKIRKIVKFVEQKQKYIVNKHNVVGDTATYGAGLKNAGTSSNIKGQAAATAADNEVIIQSGPQRNNVTSCHLHSRGSGEIRPQEQVIKLPERQPRDLRAERGRPEWREGKSTEDERSLVDKNENPSESFERNLKEEKSITDETADTFQEVVAKKKQSTRRNNSIVINSYQKSLTDTNERPDAIFQLQDFVNLPLPSNGTSHESRHGQGNVRRSVNKVSRKSKSRNLKSTSNQTLPLRRSKFRPKHGTWHNIQNGYGVGEELLNRTIRSNRDDLIRGQSLLQPEMAYGILVIRQLLRTDGGNFHCRVDFREAPTRHSQARLSVIVPPSSVDIRGPTGLRVSGMVGPYSQGDTLSLWCTVSGGLPIPSVTWWLDDELIDDLSEETGAEVTTNNLTLVGLQRRHLLRVLSCRATNSNLSTPLEASVTIDLKLPPLTVHIPDGGGQGVKEGRLHKLTCSSEGSRPHAALTWWARARQLTHTTYQTLRD